MNRIGHFGKVSLEEFTREWVKHTGREDAEEIWASLKLPERATAGSAGYDFHAPMDIEIPPGEEVFIPTGIRAWMEDGWVLMMFPRSGLGFRYRLQLNNTVGIIDSDYVHADNEGHIMCRLTNDTHEGKTVIIRQGMGMLQGIFVPFGITDDDQAEGIRTGGFGSTTERE